MAIVPHECEIRGALVLPQLHISLHCHMAADGNRWYLRDSMREVVKPILSPPDGDEWHLDRDDTGAAYIENETESLWCSDLLGASVYRDKDGRLFSATDSEGERLWLEEHFARHKVAELLLPVSGSEDIVLTVAVFENMHAGSRIWHSVPQWFGALRLTASPGNGAGYFQKRQASWLRFCSELSLGELSVRHSMPLKRPARPRSQTERGRCLPFVSLSTHALLAVVLRSVKETTKSAGGVVCESDKKNLSMFLDLLVGLLPRDFSFQLRLDQDTRATPSSIDIAMAQGKLQDRQFYRLPSRPLACRSGILACAHRRCWAFRVSWSFPGVDA